MARLTHGRNSDDRVDMDREPHPFTESRESGLQRRAETAAVPELVDAAAALDIVRRYVEAERRRNRRIVVWTGTVAFFVVVFVLTAFISIGIFVLSRTRQTADRVDAVEEKAGAYVREVAAATNRMLRIEGLSRDMVREFREGERERSRAVENVKLNLERFSHWVQQSGESRQQSMQARLEESLARVESESRKREEQLETLRKDYAFLQEAYASLQAAQARRETDGRREDVTSAPLAPAPAADRGTDLDNLLAALEPMVPPVDDSLRPDPVDPSSLAVPRAEGPATRSIPERYAEESPGNPLAVEFPNGDKYRGGIKYGLLHGWGIYTTREGDRYEGNFNYDMREGEGTLVFANGDKYVGQFRNDRMGGRGTMIYHDGSRYTGEFENGIKHGKGVMRFANGDTYTGDFKDDERTGLGTYNFADGDSYTGEFLDGLRHGQGRYNYAAGGEYAGEFVNGKKHGEGTSTYPNGKQVKGLWEDDRFLRPLPM